MIVGRYDRNGRPTIRGLVTIHRIGVQHTVSFLVDTGADRTCLHYPDVSLARVDSRLLEEVGDGAVFRGVGGTADYFVTPARVDFLDRPDRKILSYDIGLYIAASAQLDMNRPSLLGRDILDQHLMIYGPKSGRLELYRQ